MSYLILFGFGCPMIIVLIYISVVVHMIILFFSKKYLPIKFTVSDFSISIKLLYVVLFTNHVLTAVFWISNDFILPQCLLIFLVIFWIFVLINSELFSPIFDSIKLLISSNLAICSLRGQHTSQLTEINSNIQLQNDGQSTNSNAKIKVLHKNFFFYFFVDQCR